MKTKSQLLGGILIAAILLNIFQYYHFSSSVAQLNRSVAASQYNSQVQMRVIQLITSLDLEDGHENEIAERLSLSLNSPPSVLYGGGLSGACGVLPSLADVNGEQDGLKILNLVYNSKNFPGHNSLHALFDGQKIVDVLEVEKLYFNAVKDVDGDNQKELVLSKQSGTLYQPVEYELCSQGFVLRATSNSQ